MAAEAAQAINVLNRVIRYAVGLGVGASVLQTSLYTGKPLFKRDPGRGTDMLSLPQRGLREVLGGLVNVTQADMCACAMCSCS